MFNMYHGVIKKKAGGQGVQPQPGEGQHAREIWTQSIRKVEKKIGNNVFCKILTQSLMKINS